MSAEPTRFGADNPRGVLDRLTRDHFGVFIRRFWPAISGGAPMQWNWHFDAMVHQVDRVRQGDCRRLLVTLPPRNGKSNVFSIFAVAFLLGHDPRLNFVCVSYSNELSAKLGRDCLAVMQSPLYRELFPQTVISSRRSTAVDFETTRSGGRLATSVTGTLTGRGGDIIIVDDVIKPEEANSETTRNFVNNWYQSTLSSRLDDKNSGCTIVVMQRLHQYDLAGMLLEAGGWDHLNLPAIAVEDRYIPLPGGRMHHRKAGDVLHPQREGREVLEHLRAVMGSTAFAAQYQQEPVPTQGNLIKADWLQTYSPPLLPAPTRRIIQSWDTASKDNPTNDWSVCITADIDRRRIRIIDVFRRRLEFPDLVRHARRLAQEFGTNEILIEDQASGTQLIQTLRNDPQSGVPWPIRKRPEGDKFSRVAGVSAMIEAGQLLVPADAPWLADFTSELLGFPNARYDDQVDALSQLLAHIRGGEFDDLGDVAGPIIPPGE